MVPVVCPKCGREVDDQASFCPNCAHPIGRDTTGADGKRNAFRKGALFGLIGSVILFVAVILIPSVFPSVGAHGWSVDSAIIGVQMPGAMVSLFWAGFFGNPILFCIAVAFAKKMKRGVLIVLSAICLVLTANAILFFVFFYNLALVQIGIFYLWEPILAFVGSIKMLSAAMALPKK